MLRLKYARYFSRVLVRQIVQYVKDKVKLIVLTVVGPVLSAFNSNAFLTAVFVQQSVPRQNRSIWAQKVNNGRKASWSSAFRRLFCLRPHPPLISIISFTSTKDEIQLRLGKGV
jgi:hypothetical protein